MGWTLCLAIARAEISWAKSSRIFAASGALVASGPPPATIWALSKSARAARMSSSASLEIFVWTAVAIALASRMASAPLGRVTVILEPDWCRRRTAE